MNGSDSVGQGVLARPVERQTRDRQARRLAWFLELALGAVLLLWLLRARSSALTSGSVKVVISEFLASSDPRDVSQVGTTDWIELHNRGSASVDLRGWYLTDDGQDLTKWQFPAAELPAGGYLVVYALGRDGDAAGSLYSNFRLDTGGEYLALVKPDGRTVASQYVYPAQFAGVSYGLVAGTKARYLPVPTPGESNEGPTANLGPLIADVEHAPAWPTEGDDIVVTAAVGQALAPVEAVTLHCRTNYGPTMHVPMADDGAHQDGASGDGVYGAVIPRGTHGPGDMVRYYVTARDRQGWASRWPLFQDPGNSPQYLGTMVADPAVNTRLPILYWFVTDPGAAETDEGTRASVFYDGVLYDNVLVRLRGLTGRFWPKKSFKFDFNQGYHLRILPGQEPVEELNLNSAVTDKAYIRQVLAWELYRDAGAPHSISFPMRVQQNGSFYSVSLFVEQPDERYLERQGLDPNGALYKIKLFNVMDSATRSVEKRSRLDEDHSDLQALIDGLDLPPEERTRFLLDNLNVPEAINYLAAATLIHDRDRGDNNYYMYRDTEGTEEWMIFPWDEDMTFGRTYLRNQGGTFNDVIWADRDPQSDPFSCYYVGNRLIDALFDAPLIREMYVRRLRTLMDEFLQPPDTPYGERYFERHIDALVEQMQPDVALDAARWQASWGTPQTFAQATAIIKSDYLEPRRVHLYHTHGQGGEIPDAQPAKAAVRFGEVEFDPPSGKQDEEYLTLVNDNDYAVDVSGWQIAYDVEHIFQPGVVIPAGGTLYVSPDVVAFRNRAASPHGGEGHLVQGNYRGRLSNTWGALRLYDAQGRLVATRRFINPHLLTR